MKTIRALLAAFFRLGANTTTLTGNIQKVPAGMTADAFALYGAIGMMANMDAIDWDLIAIANSTTAWTMTGTQFFNQVIDVSGAPGGGVALTLPTAAQIIAACPASIPADGYNFPWLFMNDGLGQTVTLTGGTNVTVTGNATVATNTCRHFVCNVNVNAGTVTLVNIGTMNL